MQCSVDGCDRTAQYKAAKLCQMHYFRAWRTGSTDLKPSSRAMRYVASNGYAKLFDRNHPLADSTGHVYEHRSVMWPIVGPECRPCELCGKSLDWKTCHVDHIDNDRLNNHPSNLRFLCSPCNTWRDPKPQRYSNYGEIGLIEFEGHSDTPQAWSRDGRVNVSAPTIIRRIKSGMTVEQALFGEKLTHNGNPKADNRPRKTQQKHERKNAIAISIEGFTLTAAEWSREPGVTATEASLVNRAKAGWLPVDAVFTKPRGSKPSPDQAESIKSKYRAKTRELKNKC